MVEWNTGRNTGMSQIVFNTFLNHKFEKMGILPFFPGTIKIRFHIYCNVSIL